MKNNIFGLSAILGLSGFALGEVLLDQIGPDDGSGIGTGITGSQDFEAAYDIYDIATLDNFAGNGENITVVEMVLNGWNGFVDPSSVAGYTANLHSDPSAAAVDLTGDIGSSYADAADATVSGTWAGAGWNVSMPTAMTAGLGINWVSVVPSNDFATGGQTGCADTNLGDGTLGWQANPGGGFGMPGNMQEMAGEAAYRVASDGVADPCALPLPTQCTADVDGNGVVAVSDVLLVISNWGQCGDGTFRPIGDIAPLPYGDCCVDVADILAVIGSWGEDCTPRGGCCSPDGVCTDDMTAADCADAGGEYFGDDSLCADHSCTPGACCLGEVVCEDTYAYWYCIVQGGVYRGDGVACADIDCSAGCNATAGCQLPDLGGHGSDGIIGATSDANPSAGYIVADTFHPTASGALTDVCWWGMYIDFGASADCGPGTGDAFSITYYLDDADGTVPGSILAGPFDVPSVGIPTGEIIGSGLGDITQYEYSASHPPVDVMQGECYWIAILNHTTETCFWLWETAPAGDERSAQDNSGWGANDFDLAFCVNIDTSSDGCGVFTGACCVDLVCTIETASACANLAGTYHGPNSTCADANDCQPIAGACCMSDESCLPDMMDSNCVAFGGTFMGEGTLCKQVDCSPDWYDQIGGDDGSGIGGNITASQIFEPANAAYDIATLDNFSFDAVSHVISIEAVIAGWNGFVNIAPVTNYTISVYSSPEAAGADLVGDVYAIDIVVPNLPTWTGAGELVQFDIDVTLPAGEYYFAVIPWNDFGINGQTGITDYAGGAVGDEVYWQANPNGGFGFGPFQQGVGDAAYRLTVE